MPKIEKQQKASVAIPTGSMGDIVFLLLIFFMVTTVFVVYRGIMVERPRAEMTERLEKKRGLAYMWISAEGRINIDDHDVTMDMISQVCCRRHASIKRG
jgi:biopolymer transport protein ExbD